MSEPTVCAVMLTRDRPELAARAVECFRRQTYERKSLVCLDTGEQPHALLHVQTNYMPKWRGQCIGFLRNGINALAGNADILVHWDDDDWSAPTRIAEQVAHLQESGADMVGYREMIFWRTAQDGGEAFHYVNGNPGAALGTSMCYWRRTWERVKFPNLHVGEDLIWTCNLTAAGMKVRGVSSIVSAGPPRPDGLIPANARMVATIHGANTTSRGIPVDEHDNTKLHRQWRRAPEWDNWCLRNCALSDSVGV